MLLLSTCPYFPAFKNNVCSAQDISNHSLALYEVTRQLIFYDQQVDNLDPAQMRALVTHIEREQGRLDVMVNDVWGADFLIEFGSGCCDAMRLSAPSSEGQAGCRNQRDHKRRDCGYRRPRYEREGE